MTGKLALHTLSSIAVSGEKCFCQSLLAADFKTVPPELMGCFNIIFYSNAEDVVFKVLGVA